MCSNSFGVVDDQLLYECPTNECDAQYCQKCVQAIRGRTLERSFTCLACQKEVNPERNRLIEEQLIWPRLSELYGTEKLIALKQPKTFLAAQSIMKDMDIRRIHLQSRLDTFCRHLSTESAVNVNNENLINDVQDLSRRIQYIANRMEETDRAMTERDVDLHELAQQHQQISDNFDPICEQLKSSIDHYSREPSNAVINTYHRDEAELYHIYLTERLTHFSTDQTVHCIDRSLRDLYCRKQWISFLFQTHQRLFPEEVAISDAAKQISEQLDHLIHQLNHLFDQLRTIERYTQDYLELVADAPYSDGPGARFIYLLETLRIETERLDIKRNLPRTTHLIHQWQNDYGTDDQFKPKVLELCQIIEHDLRALFTDRASIYSVPYRIGVIGHTSVGKSALIMKLAQLTHYSSMIDLERSTFGYLQFDVEIEEETTGRKIPISYIDIAGAIDTDEQRTLGNYLELIGKANCDIYLLVFDKPFDPVNQQWMDYIKNELGRRCLLVRSKVDTVFMEVYRNIAHEQYQRHTAKKTHTRQALEKTRSLCRATYQATSLEDEVYLTAAGHRDGVLNGNDFADFDLEKLRAELKGFAQSDRRVSRVCELAMLASRMAINTCFRRGYVVSKTKYRWLSAGASVIPLLDEIPAFYGREEIRQALGIHDRSSLVNKFRKTKNALEEYLVGKSFRIPKEMLRSGYFSYLISSDKDPPSASQRRPLPSATRSSTFGDQTSANFVRQGVIIAGVVGNLVDDGVRIVTPAASTALRGLSVAGIVVGVVLAPVFAGWSYYSSGNRMSEHLHQLCDDLQIVLVYLIDHLCQKVSE